MPGRIDNTAIRQKIGDGAEPLQSSRRAVNDFVAMDDDDGTTHDGSHQA